MNTEITAYPLAWPTGWKRTQHRARANFGRNSIERFIHGNGSTYTRTSKQKLTIADSRDRLHHELQLLGAKQVVISSNLRLRNDGQPLGSQREPDDPGICVYFRLNNQPRCLPCDKWDRAADNLAAIAKYVDALRGQLRWGVGSADVAFAGFKALPGGSEPIIMGGRMSVDDAARFVALQANSPLVTTGAILGKPDDFSFAYRLAAKRLHPDAGGKPEDWQTLQSAAEVLRGHHGGGV